MQDYNYTDALIEGYTPKRRREPKEGLNEEKGAKKPEHYEISESAGVTISNDPAKIREDIEGYPWFWKILYDKTDDMLFMTNDTIHYFSIDLIAAALSEGFFEGAEGDGFCMALVHKHCAELRSRRSGFDIEDYGKAAIYGEYTVFLEKGVTEEDYVGSLLGKALGKPLEVREAGKDIGQYLEYDEDGEYDLMRLFSR